VIIEKNSLHIDFNEKRIISLPKHVESYESNKNSPEFADHKPIEKLKDDEEQVKLNGLLKYNLITGNKQKHHYKVICIVIIITESIDRYELRP
jgi:hypothetical protein